jgi:signal transduction histidine kinase
MRTHLMRTAVLSVALVLALLTVGFWLVLRQRLHDAAELVLRQRMQAAQALVVVDNGRLSVEETSGDEALETGFWLYDSSGRAVASPATSAVVRGAAKSLALKGSGELNAGGTRLAAGPVKVAGKAVGTVIVGEPLAAFRDSERLALTAAIGLDVLAVAGAFLLTRRTVTRALVPVASMTAAAADWSVHDLDRRFELGEPRDEVTALAATLDSMLARMSALVRHEQQLTAEIAHELKTPLSRIRSTAEVAANHGTDADRLEALHEVEHETVVLARVIDTLLAAHGPVSELDSADLAAAVEAESRAESASHPQVRLTIQAAAPVVVPYDEALLRRALTPLLSNAFRHARSEVTVSVRRAGSRAEVYVEDDGAGFREDELDRVFEPGFRGAQALGEGHGLGLALTRRLLRTVDGEIAVRPGPGGHVRVSVPCT